MVVGANVCELTYVFLWFVCGLYVGISTSPLNRHGRTCSNAPEWLTHEIITGLLLAVHKKHLGKSVTKYSFSKF